MSHKIPYLFLIVFLCAFQTITPSPTTPDFRIWFDCVQRDYTGQAIARVSYRFDGSEQVEVEDARWFGDTPTGDTMVQPMVIQPGEHLRVLHMNVGALKVATFKVVLFGKLHVVTVWDNPEFLDCPLDEQPTPEVWGTGSV